MEERERTPGGTVVVTGSSGFIGSAVCRALAPAFDVVGLDAQPPRQELRGVMHVDLDLTSEDAVRRAVGEVRGATGPRIASVIHLAAYYDFSGEPSPLYEEVTVRGTSRLLAALRAVEVEQFVFSSSVLVHAPCRPGERIDEDWPLDPKWDYPRSKVETERLLEREHGEIPLVILRIAGVYDDRCHSLPLAQQIRRIHERSVLAKVFPGDASHGQPFVHLDDLVYALARTVAVRERLPPSATILVGEPETLSYDELQRQFGKLLHHEDWATARVPKAVAKAAARVQGLLPAGEEFIKPWMIDLADEHYELDITRARTLLGWEPRRSLREALPHMVDGLRRDPAGWYAEHRLKPPVPVAPQRPQPQP